MDLENGRRLQQIFTDLARYAFPHHVSTEAAVPHKSSNRAHDHGEAIVTIFFSEFSGFNVSCHLPYAISWRRGGRCLHSIEALSHIWLRVKFSTDA